MSQVPEHAAVIAALARDDEGLASVVRAHHRQLLRFGRAVCGNAMDADDAVQDALVTLARRPDMRGEQGLLAWLLTLVKNRCLRLLRQWRRRDAQHAELGADAAEGEPSLTPEQLLERYRVGEIVRAALARLEPEQREIILLRDIEELSGERVCAALGLSDAAMKSRLHRARAALRQALRSAVSVEGFVSR